MKKTFTLIFTLFCSSPLVVAQNIYFSEGFENGFPSGWEQTDEWQVGNSIELSSQNFHIPEHTNFLCFNDDANGIGSGDDFGRVITAPIALPNFSESIWLQIDSYFKNGGSGGANETAKLSITTNDGQTWTEINSLEEIIDDWMLLISEINPSYSGQTVRFAFDYDDGGGWNYGWCIDGVEVREYFQRDVQFDFNNKEVFFSGALVGAPVYGGGGITNNGLTLVTSLDLNITANGATITETITGLNIGTNEKAFVQMTTPFLMVEGAVDFTVSVSNVNGMGDDENTSNDAGPSYSVTSVTPHPDRGVLCEEGTATSCTWCPRGTVYLEGMIQRYPGHFVGIAVHMGDPMDDEEYSQGMLDYGVSAIPNVIFNREEIIDPSEVEQPFLDLVTLAPVAKLEIGANYNDAARELTVSVDALFNEDIPPGYRFNVVIVEDSVSGSGFSSWGPSWYQVNGYSGGYNGVMDIFTLLPHYVPDSIIHYNHVARELLAGWDGTTLGLENGATAGQTHSTTFAPFNIPEDYHLEQIHIAAMLITDDGSIANTKMVRLDEMGVTGTKEIFNHHLIIIFPNPNSGSAKISLSLESSSEVIVEVFNAFGQLTTQRDYGVLSGAQTLPFFAELSEGVYFFQIRIDDQIATQRVVVVR